MKAELYDFEEGSPCPHIECAGHLRRVGDGRCSCHISPPCNWCVHAQMACTECDWQGDGNDYDADFEPVFMPPPPPPVVAWVPPVRVASPPPPPAPPAEKRWQTEHGTMRGYPAKKVGYLTDWGQWIWSTWWTVFDGSAEAECCMFVSRAEEARNQKAEADARRVAAAVAAYPTAGVMVSASVQP